MDDLLWKATIEAKFLMGHEVPCGTFAPDHRTITAWSWDVDLVRQQLHVPLNEVWNYRVLELEAQALASFTLYSYAATQAHPGWEDEPREDWGTLDIDARGVLQLADLYGRPYVKFGESPALLAHWHLIQGDSEARLHRPYDEAQWAREWPERAARHKARQAQREHEEEP